MSRKKPAARRRENQQGGKTGRGAKFWAWFAASAGAIIVTVASGLATSAGEKVLGLGDAEPTPTPTPTPAITPAGKAIKITKVTVVPRNTDKTWVFPDRLSARTLTEINDEFASFSKSSDEIMRSHGGVETGVSTVELELEGNRAKDVRITDIAIVPHCRPLLRGAVFYAPPEGTAETVKIGYNLDRDPVTAQNSKTDDSDPYPQLTGDYFADQKYTLKQDEQVTFRLSAVTREQYCEYTFELKYIADGKADSLPVENGGRPFRVSALARKDSGLDCSAYPQRYEPSRTRRGWAKMGRSRCAR